MRRLAPALTVEASRVGLGAGPLGDRSLDEAAAIRLVREALDLGVTVLDTAPSYGESERRIGRALGDLGRDARDRVLVVTKGGYGVEGVADWTPEVIAAGIDQAIARMGVDRIDVFLLHSCKLERLARGDLLAPLEHARSAGKVRAIGYSGDGAALDWAVACESFDVVECSVNLVDQRALASATPRAAARGMGVLAKRAIAAGAFASDGGRDGPEHPYARRFRTAFGDLGDFGLSGSDLDADELAIRFAAHAPGVTVALVGTRRPERLAHLIALAEKGPLPADVAERVRERFARHGSAWEGVV